MKPLSVTNDLTYIFDLVEWQWCHTPVKLHKCHSSRQIGHLYLYSSWVEPPRAFLKGPVVFPLNGKNIEHSVTYNKDWEHVSKQELTSVLLSPWFFKTSYNEYGKGFRVPSHWNFSSRVSMTSCAVVVLEIQMHLVAQFPEIWSWR